MFNWLHTYYFNLIDTPTNLFKLNLWAYINIRLFKTKITQILIFFITGLITLQQKKIKIWHKNFNFDSFLYIYVTFSILIILFLSIFL